jgi:hypothetical protein
MGELLGHKEAVKLLDENLEQEKAADQTLTEIARSGDNEQARDGEAEDRHEKEQEESEAVERKSLRLRSKASRCPIIRARALQEFRRRKSLVRLRVGSTSNKQEGRNHERRR